MTQTGTTEIEPGMTVVANVNGQHVTGRVMSTAHLGTELQSLALYSPELGHVNRIDDAVLVMAEDVATIDIVQLTEMFGEPADQQEAVAAWTGEDNIYERWSGEPQPRWTAAEAAELLRIWQGPQRMDPLGMLA